MVRSIQMLLGLMVMVSGLAVAEAGHIDGNGTGGIAYSDGEEYIPVDLYDIWEGENQKFLLGKAENLSFPPVITQGPVPDPEILRKRALERVRQVAPKLANEIDRCYWYFKNRVDTLPSGVKFSPPQDIDPTFLPEGGELVRIASFNSQTDRVLLDAKLARGLGWQLEALLLHEVIYREQRIRDGYTRTSLPARLVTACAFANNCSANEMKARTANFEYRYTDGYYSTCRKK